MISLFITLIYQPFFNLLVGLYWILDSITAGNGDMGIAVIILTIIIRVLLLPLSLNGQKTEGERREIADKVLAVEEKYEAEPLKMKQERRKILTKSRWVIVGEGVTFVIQLSIALMLWRIFNTGLSGQDVHLLYSFMPDVQQPFNLVFLGKFDLTHTSYTLNFLQSLFIFILESLSMYYSPYPVSKAEVVRLQLIYPVVAFLVFLGLPAGKKLFIITTLIFSIGLTIVKIVRWKFDAYKNKKENEPENSDEKVVVGVK